MRRGDTLPFAPTHLDLDGRGVAEVEGRALHVPDLFVGERAIVEVAHVAKGGPVAHGTIQERLRKHPARRALPCPRHAGRGGDARCTGCPLMALGEEAQRAQKVAMLRALGLEVDAVREASAPLGYRWSSKRVAFGGPGRLRLGSFVRGSHAPADMRGCDVDHPRIAAAADELAAKARELHLPAWDERRGEGVLRYVWLKTDGEEVLVTLVTASADEAPVRRLAERLEEPAGVCWAVQGGAGNAMRGEAPRVLKGRGALRVALLGGEVEVGPLGFLQPNPRAIARVYEDLLGDEGGAPLAGGRAFDLYAGAGLTTRALRGRFESVLACEAYPESARALGVEPETAEAFLARQGEGGAGAPELVLANPPRKGLGPKVTAQLAALGAPRVQIMSCGPKGLRRDLDALEAAGYRLAALHAWDTLPQTPHVELVAKLVR
ncbi:MAG TPA: hypothetical protein RMH85_34420 [Polyangiaceae bacterium LLY-WYZ-15_(1-7)]|nr:hypothetical protein [Myxococcales bacterium]MBJ72701.1 hypothetical protein [Sandaracinus sp.]HJL02981.1 hypothetical protein [Polyangiaceae bacterium LLY-WYZ-15_(1-7)]HJL13631.1 hypothetical protein [Polyangiaceae bacterium LLY-WYZ-15_(1-7)]HJL34748.1 hypothetical protein [Polyangiaceae bacterium LLY-WYZ-15_(1-7)]